MENNTVLLSVVEDLIHWPLPSSDPSDVAAVGSRPGLVAGVEDATTGDGLLTAGAVEELDEEPRERQQARYSAVRRLGALSRAMGAEWSRQEIVPYLLRCIEEEDPELSFCVGMTLMEFTSQKTCSSFFQRTDFVPVVVRMSASSDSGIRLFLIEVVVPTLFFGVPLQRNVDHCDWQLKYLKNKLYEGDAEDACGVSALGMPSGRCPSPCLSSGGEASVSGVGGGSGGGGRINTKSSNLRANSRDPAVRKGAASAGQMDLFQINVQARRLRDAINTYLCNLCDDVNELDEGVERNANVSAASSGGGLAFRGYAEPKRRREALWSCWALFVELMGTLLCSDYPASVSTAVECIGNVFSCISFVERMEQVGGVCSSSHTMLSNTEELANYTFVTARAHVGRAILSATQTPRQDLLQLLMRHHILVEKSTAAAAIATTSAARSEARGSGVENGVTDSEATGILLSGNAQNNKSATDASRCQARLLTLGNGNGAGGTRNEVRDVCLCGEEKTMHRVVRASALRSLPQLIDWASLSNLVASTDCIAGLDLFSVCEVFRQAVTPPTIITEGKYVSTGGQLDSEHINEGNAADSVQEADVGLPVVGNVSLLVESDACRDFSVAESVVDGVQLLFDELQRPQAIEQLLRNAPSPSADNLERKRNIMQQLHSSYCDCVVQMAALPSWKARWMMVDRLPQLTAAIVTLLCRVGCHDAIDGPRLVEESAAFLCQLHVEQWSMAPQGSGGLRELVHDEEEEVRSIVGSCGARVFAVVAQGIFRLLFPGGLVTNLKNELASQSQRCGGMGTRARHADPGGLESDMKGANGVGDAARQSVPSDHALLSVNTMMQHLPPLFDVIHSCCLSLLRDPEERVRSGAVTGLSILARALSTIVSVCDLHVRNTGRDDWLGCLNRATSSLMTLLTDSSPTVQLTLISELASLLATSAAESDRFEAITGSHGTEDALQLREGALSVCLHSLSKHEVWRYRVRYAALLSEMCLRFLAPNSLAAAGLDASRTPRSMHVLEVPLRENKTGNGAVVAKDDINPLRRFAKEELLPLLVDVLFDKVKAVRDSALDSLVYMCDRLSVARRLSQQVSDVGGDSKLVSVKRGAGGSFCSVSAATRCRSAVAQRASHRESRDWQSGRQHGGSGGESTDNLDDVFINDTLWPLIANSPKAMATYLSRSSLLRIAGRIGVDKKSIFLPLLDQLGHDPVLNVRLVVAKELFRILSINHGNRSAGVEFTCAEGGDGLPRVTFTEKEKSGVVLQLLRLLVEDKSADVRDEAAKALKLCF
ncbi:hypothetical protein TRVL_04212 [Trypanosoma vivax]|nr:hypothetical protein TRVL_04212 [Trypanosoma vivax]